VPTDAQRRHVAASRRASTRRLRVITGVAVAVALVSIVLVVVAVLARDDANRQRAGAESARAVASSRALAVLADQKQPVDPELSTMLAREAVRTAATPDALRALRDALDASPVRAHLAPIGHQACGKASLAFAPRGGLLAEGACDGAVRIVRARNGQAVRALRVGGQAPIVAYSRDGAQLAVGTGDGVRVYNTRDYRLTATLRGGGLINALAFARDDRRIAATDADGARVWDLPSGRGRVLGRGTDAFAGVAFDADGRTVLVGRHRPPFGAVDHAVERYDARSGRRRAPLEIRHQGVSDLQVSADERTLAVTLYNYTGDGPYGQVALYDLRSGRLRKLHSSKNVQAASVALRPDGKRVIAGWADAKLEIRTSAGRRVLDLPGHANSTRSVAYSPDGNRVASLDSEGDARIWTAHERGPVVADHAGVGVVVGDRVTWSAPDGRVGTFSLRGGQTQGPWTFKMDALTAPNLSTDGRLVFRGQTDSVAASTLPDGHLIGQVRLRGDFWSFASAIPGSARAVVSSTTNDGRLFAPVIVDFPHGKKTPLQAPDASCWAWWADQAVSPDGRLFLGTTGCGQTFAWDLRTRRIIWRLRGTGTSAAVAIDSRSRLFALATWDGPISLYSLDSRRRLRLLPGHPGGTTVAKFSPDGRWLVTGGADENIQIFGTGTWQLRSRFDAIEKGISLAATPDSRHLITAGDNGVVHDFPLCPNCGDAAALLREAGARAPRAFTAIERQTYLQE
jgi:WD40 repeat protein